MTTLALDDTTVVWTHPVEELGERPLVLLLHGRGSHERDLIQLAPMLLPEAVYASPRAPLRFEGGGGYSWFPAAAPGQPDPERAAEATRGILEWLDRVNPSGPVAVVGFSQGGALVTQLLRQAPERFAAFVNLSGFVVGPDRVEDERLKALRPPVFWGRDVADPIITQAAVDRTAEWLPDHATLTTKEYPGTGHSISQEELRDVKEFLQTHLLGGHPAAGAAQ
jgi:phospholipase/carboxylesterase